MSASNYVYFVTMRAMAFFLWLHRTRLLPAIVHDRWDRIWTSERYFLPRDFPEFALKPIRLGHVLGWLPIPDRWYLHSNERAT